MESEIGTGVLTYCTKGVAWQTLCYRHGFHTEGQRGSISSYPRIGFWQIDIILGPRKTNPHREFVVTDGSASSLLNVIHLRVDIWLATTQMGVSRRRPPPNPIHNQTMICQEEAESNLQSNPSRVHQ